ncbi:MAG: hypothetical protein RL653_121 [Pseudomonadota bacterium]
MGDAVASDAALLRPVSEQVALLRSSGVRPVLVCEAPSAAAVTVANASARALVAALEAEGERGLVLPTLNVLTVHTLPPAVAAAGPLPAPGVVLADGRFALPVVNPVALVHLQALGYVPVLVPPVADLAGGWVELGACAVAAALANALEAPAVISFCGPAEQAHGRTTWLEVAPGAASDLLAALLLSRSYP